MSDGRYSKEFISALCRRALDAIVMLLAVFCFVRPSFGQIDGPLFLESQKVFDDASLAEIYITIDPAHLGYILDPQNPESDRLFPALFVFRNHLIPGDTVIDVGFRLRGNTSRYSAKKSFKVSFNTFVPGRRFHGLKKLNLNGEHNDPSIIRSKLCWDLFAHARVPGSRANHVKVFVNDEYKGLYISVEHVDDVFVDSRFGNDDGNLYKCLWPADLQYLGPDQEAYKADQWGRRAYDLKTNEAADDYSDLVQFIDVLNNAPDEVFKEQIEELFDVTAFLKYLAVNVLVGSWDDYWYLKNNYYLYHNTQTDKFEFIPYDYDNTFGIWWGSIEKDVDWGTRDIYQFGNTSEPRPLVDRILGVPEYRNVYTSSIQALLDTLFVPTFLDPRIDDLKAMIQQAADDDYYRTLDYGFSIEDFDDSYSNALGGHVPYGLKPYIVIRLSSARNQLQYQNEPPVISGVSHVPFSPTPQDTVTVAATLTDDSSIARVTLHYDDGSGYREMEMHDDGEHGDAGVSDGVFGVAIPPFPEKALVYYFVSAQDEAQSMRNNPLNAPSNVHWFLVDSPDEEEVPIEFEASWTLETTDAGFGLNGSFNSWSRIFPMQDDTSDSWKVTLFLEQGFYEYKFVTYTHLDGQSGATNWITDLLNPDHGGPYNNSWLTVTDPIIYYLVPRLGSTVGESRPRISAKVSSSWESEIDVESIVLDVDGVEVSNAPDYFDGQTGRFSYVPQTPFLPGAHEATLSVANNQGSSAEVSTTFIVVGPALFINEFMAANDNTIQDEAGEFDDWLELYNAGPNTINLGGMYLTDDLNRTTKWCIPDTTLAPGEFLLFWGDEDQEQGPLHTNFKLSANGEQIGIFNTDAQGNVPVDTLNFGPQTADVSLGRLPDGVGGWHSLDSPSPGHSNLSTGIEQQHVVEPASDFVLLPGYPNPFNDETIIQYRVPAAANVSLRVYDVLGRDVRILVDRREGAGTHTAKWDGRDDLGRPVSSGVYFCKLCVHGSVDVEKVLLVK